MNTKTCTRNELIELYHSRWRIETVYHEWKHVLNIQNLRSQTPLGIVKEVHAHLLLSNLIRWVMTEATEHTPHTPVEVSFATSVSYVQSMVPAMFRLSPAAFRRAYDVLLKMIRAATIRQRPGRSYPRRWDGKIKNMGYGKYRLPAQLKKH